MIIAVDLAHMSGPVHSESGFEGWVSDLVDGDEAEMKIEANITTILRPHRWLHT